MTTEFEPYTDLAQGIFRDAPDSLLYWPDHKGATNWRRAEHQQQACIVVAGAARSSLGPMAAHFCLDELYEAPELQEPLCVAEGPEWDAYVERTMVVRHAQAEQACDQEVMGPGVELEDADGIFTARGVDQLLDDGRPPASAQPGWSELAAQRWRTAILVSLKEDDDVRTLVAAFLDAERALSETTEGGGVFHGIAPLQRVEYEPGDPEWVETSSPQAGDPRWPRFFLGISQEDLDAAMTPPAEELSPEGQLDAAMDVVVGDRVEQAAERISAELMGAVQQLPWMPAPEVVSTQDVKALLLTLLKGKHLDPTEPWRNRQQLQPLRDMLSQIANDEDVWRLLGEADKP